MFTVCYVPYAVLGTGIGRKAPALTEFRRQRGRISRDERAMHCQVEMGAKKSKQCKQSGVGLSFRWPRKASDISPRRRPEGRTGAAVRKSGGRALEAVCREQ